MENNQSRFEENFKILISESWSVVFAREAIESLSSSEVEVSFCTGRIEAVRGAGDLQPALIFPDRRPK